MADDHNSPTQPGEQGEILAPEVEAKTEEGGPAAPNGVLVLKVPNSEGGLDFPVQTLGNVQVTEVQTILEKGIQAYRRQVGL